MYAYVELLLSLRVHSVVSPPLLNEIIWGSMWGYKQETTIQKHDCKLVLQSHRRPMKPTTFRSCG